MIAELGLLALITALIFSLLILALPMMSYFYPACPWQRAIIFYVYAEYFSVLFSYISLMICFLNNDFSVIYVLNNSSTALPFFYKFCAVWGGHEGSMLLWVVILSTWMSLVCRFSRSLDEAFRFKVLMVMAALNIGFILFIIATSNPFLRQFEIIKTLGRDLNPLLQDIGFLFHPPMLYMGYVGFSVAFAFAISSLWQGEMHESWVKWTRPWTLAAWSCLTAGITLGSWWAYRELGWGGFWFWDPVENASFMPWLTGTALIHSMASCEKNAQFRSWTLLMAIMAFSLSLVGAFLVRSGVLTSVHAFAVDPKRGLYILLFLSVVIGGSFLLFAWRGSSLISSELQHQKHPSHHEKKPIKYIFSRESALFLNNLLLVVAMLTILLGTIYPLLIDGLGLGKLSVGAPYFNKLVSPIFILSLMVMGFAVHLRWQGDALFLLIRKLRGYILIAVLGPAVISLYFQSIPSLAVYLGLTSGFWVVLSTAHWVLTKIQEGLKIKQGLYGMVIAHLGVAITMIGIAVSTGFGVQKDLKMAPQDMTVIAGYQVRFMNERPLKGPNYQGTRAEFLVSKAQYQAYVYPEKRLYDIGQMAMTEAAVSMTFFRDIYIAMGEPLSDEAWSVRVYYKPLVRWIWGGGFLIMFGAFIAMTDLRYYSKSLKSLKSLVSVEP